MGRGRAFGVGLVVLVSVVAAGAAVRGRLSDAPVQALRSGARSAWIVIAVVLAVVAVGLYVQAVLEQRRRRPEDYTARKRGATIVVVLFLALVLVPFALTGRGGTERPTHPPVGAPDTIPARVPLYSQAHSSASGPGSGLDTAGLIVAAVVVLAAAGALLLTRRRGHEPDAPEPEPEYELAAAIDAGVRGGVTALESSDDARVAITRCYLAMQRSVEHAGLDASPVRTPSELLAVAVDRGLVPAEPAERLTRLFERARFSSDQLGDRERDDARAALDAMSQRVLR